MVYKSGVRAENSFLYHTPSYGFNHAMGRPICKPPFSQESWTSLSFCSRKNKSAASQVYLHFNYTQTSVRGSSTASEDVSYVLSAVSSQLTSIAGRHMVSTEITVRKMSLQFFSSQLLWNQEPREEQNQIKTGWWYIFKDFRCTYAGDE